jgi:hypothetical protein
MIQSIRTGFVGVSSTLSYWGAVARQEPRAVALTQELVGWYNHELDTIIATSGRLDTLRAKIVYIRRAHLLGRRFTAVCRARIRAEYGGEGE